MAFPVTLNGRTYTLADFSGNAYVDGFPDALEDFVTQAGDVYNTTSTTSVSIATGSQTFTVAESGKPYVVGTPLRAASQADPDNFMDGTVTAYSGTSLTIDIKNTGGSGTYADWNITIGGGTALFEVPSVVSIVQGGTGASTASSARINLGVPETIRALSDVDNTFSGATHSETSTSVTATVGERVSVDTAGQTVTLPVTPSDGDIVGIVVGDFTDTTVARNGSTIMDLAEDLTIDTAYASIDLMYITDTWRIV